MKNILLKNLQWVYLVALMLIWGSSFILMKRSLVVFDPVETALLRIGFASVVFIPFVIYFLKQVPKNLFLLLFLVGFIGNLVPAYLFAKAQTGIDSSLSGILNATTPFFAMMVGAVFFKLKVRFIHIVGLILGLLGSVQIIGRSGSADFFQNLYYVQFIVIATIMYAFNINLIKVKLADFDSSLTAVFSISMVGIPSIFLLFIITDFSQKVTNPVVYHALIYPAILGIMCTSVALMMYYHLIKISGVIFSSSVTYFVPIVALFIGVADGEQFYASNIIWIILIIIGIYFVNMKSKIVPLKERKLSWLRIKKTP